MREPVLSKPAVVKNLAGIELRDNRWTAVIGFNGLTATAGSYYTAEEAQVEARKALEQLERWELQHSDKMGPLRRRPALRR